MSTDRIEASTLQTTRVLVELGKVPGKAVAAVQAATAASAERVAEKMRTDAEGHETFPDFPRTINSGPRPLAGFAIEYEIGPDKDYKRVAALGNILYFGTSEHPPVLNIGVGIDAEEPAWLTAVQKAATGSFGDVGS